MTRTFNTASIRLANFEAWLASELSPNVRSKIAMPISSRRRRSRAILEIAPRGLSRTQAAALTGLSPTTFDKARREGKYPGPTLPGGRWDRKVIEKAMDRSSGLRDSETPLEDLDDTWSDFGQPVKR